MLLKGRASLGRPACPRIVQPVLRSKMQQQPMCNSYNLSSSESSPQSNDSANLEPMANNHLIKSYQPIQTPRSELNENIPLLHSVSSMIFDLNDLLLFDVEPQIMKSPPTEIPRIFADKCSQCCKVCDFTNDQIQLEEKNCKTEILTDILKAVSDQNIVCLLKEEEYIALYHSFRRNVIRAPPQPPKTWFSPVAIDFTLDRVEENGWPHLSLFYDIIITFLSNRKFNTNYGRNETQKMAKGIISLFQSPDNRERVKVMKVFHAIYRSFNKFRNYARSITTSYLSELIYTTIPKLGIHEILNAYIPIIAGFKVPIHQENLDFFHGILIPLHSSPIVHMFHTPLVEAIISFVVKQSNLTIDVYNTLFIKWPVTSPTKQLLFLNEIEKLADLLPADTDSSTIIKICKIVIRCLNEENFTVAERALMLWESDAFMTMVGKHCNSTFTLLIPAIYKAASTHWCTDVRTLALNALKILKGQNFKVFEQYGSQFKRLESDKVIIELSHGKIWYNIIMQYEKNRKTREDKCTEIQKYFIGCEMLFKNDKNCYAVSNHAPTDTFEHFGGKRKKLPLMSSMNSATFSQQKNLCIARQKIKK
ncbi:phosphoprotein phosphatase [Tritrichomonas foetus]|uniref:Phosphoprotein phosphatase n=1 Tax=Tritrichomonas foetus TaxID=1144522 RepID=A0A1J4IZW1_9EUKA|nr:phosphoprotein phosphatase [Tritrichomonas foetus]|eukprot:OHS92880.1 phosphoprotein phosphatase [Tritrichomonas foetus]